jgi:hypothetical protein
MSKLQQRLELRSLGTGQVSSICIQATLVLGLTVDLNLSRGALPKTADSDCVFNLPVCYTQDGGMCLSWVSYLMIATDSSFLTIKLSDVHKKIHKKKWTTAKACKHSGLPLQ